MLVLKRKDGQWIEITHKSGDIVRFRTYNLSSEYPGRVTLAFDDDERNFDIHRPERVRRQAAGALPAESTPAETAGAEL